MKDVEELSVMILPLKPLQMKDLSSPHVAVVKVLVLHAGDPRLDAIKFVTMVDY